MLSEPAASPRIDSDRVTDKMYIIPRNEEDGRVSGYRFEVINLTVKNSAGEQCRGLAENVYRSEALSVPKDFSIEVRIAI